MKKMLDIDDLIQNESVSEKKLSNQDHFEAILYQFINLYNRFSEDRLVAAKQGSDIEKCIERFSAEVTRFEDLEDNLREEIETSIHKEAKNMAEYMGRTVADAARQEIKPIINKLTESLEEAEDILSQYQRASYREKWIWIGATIFTSILASILTVRYLMPQPVLPLTEDQFKTYQSGQVFEMVIPKLSKRQQDLIFDIARGRTKNTEKLFQDEKKKQSIS